MKCPYYRKVVIENLPFGLKTYCEADPQRGPRLPSLFEERHFCTTLQYPACRVFQARQEGIGQTETPKTSQGQ
jgi:hypothetical protein